MHFIDGCVCGGGYIGDDCSVSVLTPPTVFDQPGSICDLRLSDCSSATVVGIGFVDSSNLVCYIQELEVGEP